MASKSFHGRQPEQNDLAEGISRLKFLIIDFRFMLTLMALPTVVLRLKDHDKGRNTST